MRSYYEEEEGEELGEDGQPAQRTFLPDEHLRVMDWFLAVVLAALVFVGMSFFSFPGLVPEVWNNAAVAAGLRPPADVFPGFWRMVVRLFFLGGAPVGEMCLRFAGRVCAAITAGMVYLFLRSLLASCSMWRPSLERSSSRVPIPHGARGRRSRRRDCR